MSSPSAMPAQTAAARQATAGHDMTTAQERRDRYLSTPRLCIDCGGEPSAGRPRCETCHDLFIQARHEGRET